MLKSIGLRYRKAQIKKRVKQIECNSALLGGVSTEAIIAQISASCAVNTAKSTDVALSHLIELSARILGMRPYTCQIEGILATVSGFALDMKTGEGKTLVCTLSAALLSYTHGIVRVATSTDMLSKRDYLFSKPLFDALSISSSRTLSANYGIQYQKIEVMVGDWLKDHHSKSLGALTHRGFGQEGVKYAVILDEIDDTLINSSEKPFGYVIKAPVDIAMVKACFKIAQNVCARYPDVVSKEHQTELHENHFDMIQEVALEVEPQYDFTLGHFEHYQFIRCSLIALISLEKGRDYTVRGGTIYKYDRATGREVEYGFKQQFITALELKESLPNTLTSVNFALSSLQNYIKRYDFISGMSGTASVNANELLHIYALPTFEVPPKEPSQLVAEPEALFINKDAKREAIVERISHAHGAGCATLVICDDEPEVELLQRLLADKKGIDSAVLVGSNIKQEAELLEYVSKPMAVLFSTRICGRGVDITPTGDVDSNGGLSVISTTFGATVDDDVQLMGRTARQGARGSYQVIASLEDKFFTRDILKKIPVLKDYVCAELPLEHNAKIKGLRLIVRGIQNKNKVREKNVRKQLMYFDEPMSSHLDFLRQKRMALLNQTDFSAFLSSLDGLCFDIHTVEPNFLNTMVREVLLDILDRCWVQHSNEMMNLQGDCASGVGNAAQKYRTATTKLLNSFPITYFDAVDRQFVMLINSEMRFLHQNSL